MKNISYQEFPQLVKKLIVPKFRRKSSKALFAAAFLLLSTGATSAATIESNSTAKQPATFASNFQADSRDNKNRAKTALNDATAAVFTVNTNLDNEANGCAIGLCTLREAISDANATTQPDTIVFAPGVTGTMTLTGGQLVISSSLTINGPGARNLSISGNNTDRVFLVATPVLGGNTTINISGLKIINGFAQPVVIGSTVIGDGGGILNGALLGILGGTSTLNLTEVTIDNNVATTLGGGVATRLGAVTNITRSTISRNTSNATLPALGGDVGGGGISNIASITTLNNSTVSDNNTLAAGGGILNAAGVLNLTNSTISNNSSTVAGGGIVSAVSVLTPILGVTNLRNTIVADNNGLLATNILGRDVIGVAGSFNSLGHNMVGSNYGAEGNFIASLFNGTIPIPNSNGDIIGNISLLNQVISPMLGALQNNGGQTDTRQLQVFSPLIDRGDSCVINDTCSTPLPFNSTNSFDIVSQALTTDQRGTGFQRQYGMAVEIGAVETNAPTAAGATITGRVTQGNGKGIFRAIVTLTDGEGIVRTTTTNSVGAFTFETVEVQQTYLLQARHKQYVFVPQILTPTEDLLRVNLIGTPSGFKINSAF